MNDQVRASTRTMNDGREIPLLGLGTYPMTSSEADGAVASALAAGYRLIDTAAKYDNEAGVGRAIRDSGVPRGELFVQTKLEGADHGFQQTKRGFQQSLERLGLDYVDSYLIHWPLPQLGRYVDSYRAMIELKEQGLIRSLGVSNFKQHHVERLVDETGVVPALNQIQLSPAMARTALRRYLTTQDITPQAWAPLGQREGVPDSPVALELAERYGVAPTQVVLRWHVQQGFVAIPKSTNPERQRLNAAIFDFTLTDAEIAALSELDWGESAASDSDERVEL